MAFDIVSAIRNRQREVVTQIYLELLMHGQPQGTTVAQALEQLESWRLSRPPVHFAYPTAAEMSINAKTDEPPELDRPDESWRDRAVRDPML